MTRPAPIAELPLVGRVTDYLENDAPDALRRAVTEGTRREILDASFPYQRMMDKAEYEAAMKRLQPQLMRMMHDMHDVIATQKRVAVLLEGRDAAG